ncbi:flagellar type III secretion system pore protein FliP [Candidatus Poribacteria bacterium]|nr:flagellar type III secretion system pore protein FliP [Candidatus Poribacteria bacterium]
MRRGFAPGTGGGLRRRRLIRWCATLCVCVVLGLLFSTDAGAQTQRQQAPVSVPSVPTIPDINFRISTGDGEPRNFASNLQILFFLTVLSLAPSILIMMTSFTRIVIVLSFLRQALGTQQMPPNQIMIGLSLFLTMYIMLPTWTDINQNALQPYLKSEITQPVAFQRALVPLRAFMFRQTRERDLALMVRLSQSPNPANESEVGTLVLIPAFIISELKTAFQLAFFVYLPFVVVDLVVASALMSIGVMMLPPLMISLPLKLLLFVLADGWNLLVTSLVTSFR